MRPRPASALLLALAASPAAAAPPEVKAPEKVSGPVGAFITVKCEATGPSVKFVPLDSGLSVFPSELLVDPKATVVTSATPGWYRLLAYTGDEGGPSDPVTILVIIGAAPQPPPDPKPDPKPPPDPKPEEVTSFRVFMVYKAGELLTPAQISVLDGVVMNDALVKATAGDPAKFGWRKIDRDARPDTLPAGLKEAWAAAQNSIKASNSATPLIVWQVNEQITIEPLPKTPAEGALKVEKYRSGK